MAYGKEKSGSRMETHGEKRRGGVEKTIPGGHESDSGSKQEDLCKVAANLNAGKGSSRGLPAR